MSRSAAAREATGNGGSPAATRESEGQRLLGLRPESYGQLAEMLGTNKGSVHRWRSGEKTPGPEARARMEQVLGIPSEAWGRAAGSAPAPLEPSPATTAIVVAEARRASTEEELYRLLVRVRDINTSTLLPTEVARIRDTEAKILGMLYRCERERSRDLAELEGQLVGHPSFRRMQKALVAALRPHPAALAAALEALRGVLGEAEEDAA